jgi:nitrous oxidase accessory protein
MSLIILAALALPAWGAQDHRPPAPKAGAPSAQLGDIGRRVAAAAPGSVVEIPPGVYHERLRIDKPLTLVGVGSPVIDAGGAGDAVEIGAPGVELRGFVVRATGNDLDAESAGIRVLAPRARVLDNRLEDVLFGIDLREAPDCVVRGNSVGGKKLDIARRGDGLRLWRSDRTVIEGNTFHDGRDAIIWYSTGVVVRANTARRCRYGFHMMYTDSIVIEDNLMSENSVGLYLMYSRGVEIRGNRLLRNRGPSGYGVGMKETDRFSATDNVVVGNRVGIYLDGSPFSTDRPGLFTGNTIACNDVGMTFLPAVRGTRIVGNNFIDNIEQVCVQGRGSLEGNEFWHGEEGNFWSDYVGYDKDADGVGDFVHESQTLFESLVDREPRLRLFMYGPAHQAIEFVGRALPAVRPEPKFTDEVPRMHPVAVRALASDRPARPWSLGGVAAALLGAGVAAVASGRRAWSRGGTT